MRALIAVAFVLSACVTNPPVASRSPTAAPTATATPTVAVSTTPTPSPSSTAIPQNVRLAVVLADGGPPTPGALRLRLESDGAPFATLNGTGAVVSPDGTRIAYWSRPTGGTQATLRVLDPFSGNETDLANVTATPTNTPGDIAWRDDAGGLVYAVRTPGPSTSGVNPPATTIFSTYVFATRQVSEVKKIDSSGSLIPLSWNLATHVIAAVETGEGGVRQIYRFKEDGGGVGNTPSDERLHEVTDVTKDARVILAQYGFFSGNRLFSGVRTVSATDTSPIAQHEAADGFLLRARFRPATGDVLALLRVGDPSRYVLEVWSGTDLSTVKRVWNGPPAPVASGDLVARIDGKAAYVRVDQTGSALPLWQVVDLSSGTPAPVSFTNAVATGPWCSFYISDEGLAKLKK